MRPMLEVVNSIKKDKNIDTYWCGYTLIHGRRNTQFIDNLHHVGLCCRVTKSAFFHWHEHPFDTMRKGRTKVQHNGQPSLRFHLSSWHLQDAIFPGKLSRLAIKIREGTVDFQSGAAKIQCYRSESGMGVGYFEAQTHDRFRDAFGLREFLHASPLTCTLLLLVFALFMFLHPVQVGGFNCIYPYLHQRCKYIRSDHGRGTGNSVSRRRQESANKMITS